MDDSEQVRIKYVKLTNGLDISFTDRHDGVPVRLDPGQTKNIPIDQAEHFFGRDLSSREAIAKHVCRRQGWNTPKFLELDEKGRTLAERWVEKLKIELVMYKLVEVEADPSKPIPAKAMMQPPKKQRSRKTLARGKRASLREGKT